MKVSFVTFVVAAMLAAVTGTDPSAGSNMGLHETQDSVGVDAFVVDVAVGGAEPKVVGGEAGIVDGPSAAMTDRVGTEQKFASGDDSSAAVVGFDGEPATGAGALTEELMSEYSAGEELVDSSDHTPPSAPPGAVIVEDRNDGEADTMKDPSADACGDCCVPSMSEEEQAAIDATCKIEYHDCREEFSYLDIVDQTRAVSDCVAVSNRIGALLQKECRTYAAENQHLKDSMPEECQTCTDALVKSSAVLDGYKEQENWVFSRLRTSMQQCDIEKSSKDTLLEEVKQAHGEDMNRLGIFWTKEVAGKDAIIADQNSNITKANKRIYDLFNDLGTCKEENQRLNDLFQKDVSTETACNNRNQELELKVAELEKENAELHNSNNTLTDQVAEFQEYRKRVEDATAAKPKP